MVLVIRIATKSFNIATASLAEALDEGELVAVHAET